MSGYVYPTSTFRLGYEVSYENATFVIEDKNYHNNKEIANNSMA